MSRMTEYIAIEDDNVMTHFLQSFRNWDGRLQWMLILAIQMDECLVIHMTHWNCILKVCRNHCKLSRFVLVIDWYDYFLPWSFYASTSSTYPPLISTQSWQWWSISWRSCLTMASIDAQISTSSGQICPKDRLKSTRRSCKYLANQNFPERKWSPHSPGMRWDNFSSHTI